MFLNPYPGISLEYLRSNMCGFPSFFQNHVRSKWRVPLFLLLLVLVLTFGFELLPVLHVALSVASLSLACVCHTVGRTGPCDTVKQSSKRVGGCLSVRDE